MVASYNLNSRSFFIGMIISVTIFILSVMGYLSDSYQANSFESGWQDKDGSLDVSNNSFPRDWTDTADCRAGGQRAKVIIYTRFRSGSSFVGDIFSHHPDVYYMFEPMQLYTHAGNTNHRLQHISQHGATFLNQTLHCDIQPLLKDVERFHKEGHKRIGYLGPTTFCRKRTLRLMFAKNCDTYRPETIVKRCQKNKHVVIKTIAMRNLTSLKSLLKDGVKVIHLVRDPRGQILSMNRYTRDPIAGIIEQMCPLRRQDLLESDALFEENSSCKQNYVMVRYEDVAGNPEVLQQKLFSFTGITDHKYVHMWLDISTNLRHPGPMSTQRVSRQTGEAWRRNIGFKDLSLIQSKCGDIIEKLGYRKLESQHDLRATEFSVVNVIPSNHQQPLLM